MRKTVSLALLIALTGCGVGAGSDLAARGDIDAAAPVHATASIIVNAPPERVWALLSDIQAWPSWHPAVTDVAIAKPPAPGVHFEWSTSAGRVHSRLALVDPPHRLAWTGRFMIFHAIHVWEISPLPGGRTFVETRESMSGWPVAWLYGSPALLDSDQDWLADLKQRAER